MKRLLLFLLLTFCLVPWARGQFVPCPMSDTVFTPTPVSTRTTIESVTIPVFFHVIHRESGANNVSDSDLEIQLDALNDAFAGSGQASNLSISFVLAGISRTQTDNGSLFRPGGQIGPGENNYPQQILHVDTPHVLNFYTVDLKGQTGIAAYFPWWAPEDDFGHGVFVDYHSMPGGGSTSGGGPWDTGDWGVHEVGHYLGAYHTFEGEGCGGSGDGVADTPEEAFWAFGCPIGRDTCPADGDDPINNFMDYTHDDCRTELTAGQFQRIAAMIDTYKPGLLEEATIDMEADFGLPIAGSTDGPGGPFTGTYHYEVANRVFDFSAASTVLIEDGTDMVASDNATLQFDSGDVLKVEGSFDATSATFEPSGSDWSRIEVAIGGTFDVTGPVTITNPDRVVVRGNATFRVATDGDLTVSGGNYRFAQDVQFLVEGGLDAQDVEFKELNPGTGWDGIFVNSSGQVYFDGVIVEHADVGIKIRSNNSNVFRNTLFDQNGVGIMADFETSGFAPQRSRFDLFDSCVTNSVFDDTEGLEGHGIWGRWTNARIVNSTVEKNDGYGAYFENADLNIAHGLLVTDNGVASSGFRDGLHSGVNGDITLASPLASPLAGSRFFVGPDRNSIHDNDQNQISLIPTGFATVGAACSPTCPIGNGVYGTFANPTPKLIRNEPVGIEITAERVFWNTTPADPPDLAFFRPSDVNDKGALSSDPATDAGRAAGCDREDFLTGGSSSARSGETSSFLADTGAQNRGFDDESHAWVRERIQSMRRALSQNPAADTASALLGRLYGLQRLDRDDELGEHSATMGVLTSIRAHLLGGQQIPATLRATAEAALIAGVHDLMRREHYEQATQVVRLFSSRVDDEQTKLALAIADASLDEVDGDFGSAIAKYIAIIEVFGQGREQLVRDLEATVALLIHEMGEEGYRAAEQPVYAAISGEESSTPVGLGLEAAYPNPFNPQTVVPFVLDRPADVRLSVYDVLGREVALLAAGVLDTGRHEVAFDASALPSGTYLIRMTARPENEGASHTFTQRITLLR